MAKIIIASHRTQASELLEELQRGLGGEGGGLHGEQVEIAVVVDVPRA